MLFWSLAALLLLFVVLVLAWPLLRPAGRKPAEDDYSLNLGVYKDQLQELATQQEDGLLTEEQAEQVRQDIERSLLQEVLKEGADPAPTPPVLARRWPVAVVAVLLTAVSLSLYMYLGSPGATTDHGAAPASVDEMVHRLEQRLQTNPDDVDGWLMLARSYIVLRRFNDAVTVMQRLYQELGDEPVIMIRYAHALAMANGGRFSGKATTLINRVLKIEPENPSALWFAGVAADQRGDYQAAIDYWQKLVPQLGGQEEALQRVQQLISDAQVSLQGGGAAPAQNAAAAKKETAAEGGKSIKVHVSLAQSLQGKVDPSSTLFIFARSPTGLPMPLAVVRRHAGDLPLDIVLDDSLAMSPQHMLSDQDKVDLVARISRSGNVRGESGDVQGELQGVAVGGKKTISLVIDSKIP
jgi:cytochrome c-type biogenesis protein CcmH